MKVRALIDCAPAAKGRPRFGKGRAFKDDATAGAERTQAVLLGRHSPPRKLEGPVALGLVFTVAHDPTKRPDLDNYVKLTMDVLTRLGWWTDDRQVVELTASKVRGAHPSVLVEVLELEHRG